MSIIKSSSTKDAAVAANGAPLLTPEQVVEQLRLMQQQIPDFVQLPNGPEIRRLRRLASVDAEFAREGIVAVGASAVVRDVIGNTVEELHQAEDEIARWAGLTLPRLSRTFLAAQRA